MGRSPILLGAPVRLRLPILSHLRLTFYLSFAAFIFAAALAAPLYGFWVYKTKDAKHVLLFGYASFLAGVIGMATVKLGTNQVVILYCCLCGIGFAAPLVFLNSEYSCAILRGCR